MDQDLDKMNISNQGGRPKTEVIKPPTGSARTITSLPLNSPFDYSPYFGLEFNLAVQDYCRTRSNHILHKSNHYSPNEHNNQTNGNHSKVGKPAKTQAYNSVNTPFSKITRSCKVVVSGDVAVGKTSLVNRFGLDLYSDTYRTTIGVDFDLQRYSILGQPFTLQIWDTAGLERFRCITNSYYRGCQVALLVFDMSNMSTLANVFKWKEEVLAGSKTFDQLSSELETFKGVGGKQNRDQLTACSKPLLFLVGTKSDLPLTESSRVFIKEQANKIAARLQAELWFVSARTGENVNELFNRIAALSFNQCILGEIQRARFESSTMGACLKEKFLQQQRELWNQSSKLIKITRRKDGDDRRTRCVNIQCVIK